MVDGAVSSMLFLLYSATVALTTEEIYTWVSRTCLSVKEEGCEPREGASRRRKRMT